MSRTIDGNVLVYATNDAEPLQGRAQAVIRELAAGSDPVSLLWPVLLGYVRIATHPALIPNPLTAARAMGNVAALLDRPHIRAVGEADGFWRTFTDVAGNLRGNDVPDAHLVTLMRQHGIGTILTRDRGFRRFDGIRVQDPFS